MSRTVITPANLLPPARTLHAWAHRDDLREISAREKLGALLDRRDAAREHLEDALVVALLVAAFPDHTAHSVAQLHLLEGRLEWTKIDGELCRRWSREVGGALPEPYRRPAPQPAPSAPQMTAAEQLMEKAVSGSVEAMHNRLRAA